MKSKFLKKLLSAMLVGTAVCSLAACSGGADTGEPAETQTEESAGVQAEAEDTDAGQEPAAGEETDAAAGEGGALVAYFSWSGNTQAVAQEIQDRPVRICLRSFRPSLIQMTMTNSWISHRRSKAATPARQSQRLWICPAMTPCISVSPTGGEICP